MTWTIEFVDGPLAGRRDHVEADVLPKSIERVDANVWFRYRVEAPSDGVMAQAWFTDQREGPAIPDQRGAFEPINER